MDEVTVVIALTIVTLAVLIALPPLKSALSERTRPPQISPVSRLMSHNLPAADPTDCEEEHQYDAEYPWRAHPHLRGRFHPDHPDDIQIIAHDGGPRMTEHSPEIVWVRVFAGQADTFQGRVLNSPTQLESVQRGDTVTFIAVESAKYPVLVSGKYLSQRSEWFCHPCSTCGFDELFDAPTDLISVVFPNMPKDGTLKWFTSFCPLCGGAQVVENKSGKLSD